MYVKVPTCIYYLATDLDYSVKFINDEPSAYGFKHGARVCMYRMYSMYALRPAPLSGLTFYIGESLS